MHSPVATVLTVYGIETMDTHNYVVYLLVATVLTVYGIETQQCFGTFYLYRIRCNSTYRLRY